jgi:biotin carboxylase
MQSDIGVPTVGVVVDALGLPGCGRDVAECCSNKILTRQAFERHGVPQPRFAIAGSVEEAVEAASQIGFPSVVKAPDSSGSRGVVRVNNIAEMSDAFLEAKRFTRGELVLVEEFIFGLEIGAQAFCVDGRCRMVLIHDDELSKPPFMIPVAHAFPSTLSPSQLLNAEVAISACVEALGITEGPSNVDLIIDSEGNPKIIEVGARIGATCLPELVKYHTGIDWSRAAVEVACGMKPNLKPTYAQPCAAFILESCEEGLMSGYDLPEYWRIHPDVLEWEVTAKPGEMVSRLRKGTDRIGKVVTQGITTQAAIDLARGFRDALQILITDDSKKSANG